MRSDRSLEKQKSITNDRIDFILVSDLLRDGVSFPPYACTETNDAIRRPSFRILVTSPQVK